MTNVDKLAFLIPSLRYGGAERTVSLLAKHLPLEVSICLFERVIDYPVGCKMYVIGDDQGLGGTIKRYTKYYSFLRSYKPDVVISLLNRAHTLNLVCRHQNKRFLWIQNYPTEPYVRHRLYAIEYEFKHRVLYKYADGLLGPSEALIERLVRDYGIPRHKAHLVYNPVDLEMIDVMASEELSEDEEDFFGDPTIVNVGRLVWQKGQWHLIRIFSKLVHYMPSARLLIIGGGHLKMRLNSLVEKLGLDSKVHILGPKRNPYKYMARSDVFCLTSLKEGLPIVIIEALACELPVIASDCLSGPREILAPNTKYKYRELHEPELGEYGVLMPVLEGEIYDEKKELTFTESLWADTLMNLLTDKKLLKYYKQRGKERAKHFDVRNVATMLLNAIVNKH